MTQRPALPDNKPPPDAAMLRDHQSTLVVALLFGVLFYVAAYALGLPAPKYLPVTGEWRMTPPENAIKMGYYGLLLWGIAGWTLGYVLGRQPMVQRMLAKPRVCRFLGWGSIAVVLFGLVHFVSHELSRWN